MFQKDPSYLPTMKEIRNGIIKGMINLIQVESEQWSENAKFEFIKDSYFS